MVTEKTDAGFVVEEMGSGNSNAGFDWFVIARKPILNKNGKKIPQPMPEALAEMPGTPDVTKKTKKPKSSRSLVS